jgi:hypothetical protein
LAKHLPALGWRPIIVRANERFYTERSDPALAALVPESLEQIATGAIPANITKYVGINDIGLRGFFHFKGALERLSTTAPLDAVLITGAPYYPMLLTGWIRRKLGVPVVLDFQDPWVSAWGATLPKLSKGGVAHGLARILEPQALRQAAFITSVSDIQNEELAALYPWVDRKRMAAIPIGGDPEDFAALRANPPHAPSHELDPSRINLSYVGTHLPRAEPILRQIFQAARQVRDSRPDLATRLCLNFVGTSNQPTYAGPNLVLPIAIEEGVGDLVSETPQRVSYLEALNILANSDGILLIGSDEPHYTASKIFPALMSERPFLSVFHSKSSSHQILSQAGGGIALGFDSPETLNGLTAGIAGGLVTLATRPESLGVRDPNSYSDLTASAVAKRFALIFEQISRKAAV